ncbi:MAG: THUMP domain-containing class I SAM-dependent RNA methyltransferase [Nanobdellota archaeon]
MRFAAITSKGIERVTKEEIEELIGVEGKLSETAVFFETDFESACRVTYQAQSIHKILYVLDSFRFQTLEHLEKACLTTDWITEQTPFAARCDRHGDHPFSSKDVEERIGAKVKQQYKAPVDLDHPTYTVQIHIQDDTCIIGIDLAGIDLSKRSFMLFTTRLSLKGTIAYALTRLAGFTSNQTLIDPFSRSGIIPIEAALRARGLSPHFFNKDQLAFQYFPQFTQDPDAWFTGLDTKKEPEATIIGYDSMLKNVKAANKNAKIAGIHKALRFSRIDISWLDTKHKEKEVDCVVTAPPQLSRHKNPRDIQKIYTEFFHQLKYVLNQQGKAVLLTRTPDDLLQNDQFSIIEEIPINQGQEEFFAVIIQKA